MNRRYLLGIVALLVVAMAALVGAGAVAGVITPPGTVVGTSQADGSSPAGPGQWPDAPKPNAASGAVLLDAAFDANLDGWQPQAPTGVDSPAQWRVLKGKLVQNGDASGDWSDEEALLLSGDEAWSDYELSAQVYATSGSPVGVAWRASKDGMYRVRLFQKLPNDAPKARLELVTQNGVKLLGTVEVSRYAGYVPAAWHLVRVATAGERQQVWVDGVQLFDVADSALKSGRVGVLATADGAAAFDNVRVVANAVAAR